MDIRPLLKHKIQGLDPMRASHELAITIEDKYANKKVYVRRIFTTVKPSKNTDDIMDFIKEEFPDWNIIGIEAKKRSA